MAELAGIRPAMVRTIFGEVEEAVIGGWHRIATECSVPPEIVAIWEKEMLVQTRALRADVAQHPLKGRQKGAR
jgi:hypothetical protein